MSLMESPVRDHRFRTWTFEKEQTLREMVEQKCSAAEIGKELGFTRNAILGKMYRLKISTKENQEEWGSKEINVLYAGWNSGLSVKEIGQDIFDQCGIERSTRAISAKADRLGLIKRRIRSRLVRINRTVAFDYTVEPTVDLKPLNIPFMRLETVHCREVTGFGSDGLATYCGHRRAPDRSFCPHHQRINYYKPAPLKRKF